MGEDKDEDKIKEGFEWVKKREKKNASSFFHILPIFSFFN